MKFECSLFYISIDKEGFYFEFGDIDKDTCLFTIVFLRRGWNNE